MDYYQVCEEAKAVVKSVGEFIKTESQAFTRDKAAFKGFNDLVTYVDHESERRLVENLQPIVPEAGFLGEEDHHELTGAKDIYWIIDPLDGTLNFVHQIPVYSISVALMVNDSVRVGIVYEINQDECFYAFEGGQAYCNQEVITASDNAVFENALFATGFPFTDLETVEFYTDLMKDLLTQTRGIRRIGSAAVDLCYTAAGRFDCYYEFNLKPWDVAAGAYILQKAKGEVFDFSGGDNYLFGGEIIAGTPAISNAFLALIQEKYKKQES